MQRRVIKAFIVGKDLAASVRGFRSIVLKRVRILEYFYASCFVHVLLVSLGGDTDQFVHADRVEGGGPPGSMAVLWNRRSIAMINNDLSSLSCLCCLVLAVWKTTTMLGGRSKWHIGSGLRLFGNVGY